MTRLTGLVAQARPTARWALGRTGAPYGQYMLAQAIAGDVPAKLQVYLAAWALLGALLAALLVTRSDEPKGLLGRFSALLDRATEKYRGIVGASVRRLPVSAWVWAVLGLLVLLELFFVIPGLVPFTKANADLIAEALQVEGVTHHLLGQTVDGRDLDLLQVGEDVGRNEHGLAHLAELDQELADLHASPGVQARGGLVEKQDLRIVQENPRYAQALLHTRRIRLGPLGHLLPFHQPVELAHRVAYLDHMAEGRYQLGVGIGVLPTDHALFALDASHGRNRRMTFEAIDIMTRLWSEGASDYRGEFWSMGEGRGAPSFFLSITSFPKRGHEMHVLMPGSPGNLPVEDYHGVTLHRYLSAINFMPEAGASR